MTCTGCGRPVVGTQASTWILQEPRDLRGWRAQLCEECDEARDRRPIQNRVVLALRKMAKETTIARNVERV